MNINERLIEAFEYCGVEYELEYSEERPYCTAYYYTTSIGGIKAMPVNKGYEFLTPHIKRRDGQGCYEGDMLAAVRDIIKNKTP